MNITTIGRGKVGGGLAHRWERAGGTQDGCPSTGACPHGWEAVHRHWKQSHETGE